jgi:hypothetical protein
MGLRREANEIPIEMKRALEVRTVDVDVGDGLKLEGHGGLHVRFW